MDGWDVAQVLIDVEDCGVGGEHGLVETQPGRGGGQVHVEPFVLLLGRAAPTQPPEAVQDATVDQHLRGKR